MRKILLSCFLGLLLPVQAFAQSLDAGVVIGNEAALSIAVVPMPYKGSGKAPDQDVAAIISNDLNRSGQFKSIDAARITDKPVRASDVNFGEWKRLKQDFLVVGRVVDAGDGNFTVEYELLDVAKQQSLLSLSMPARASNVRRAAHQIADQIYQKILGVRGAFDTRIAYVTASGTGQAIEYRLMVADSDGFNPQTLVRSREPLLSPAWSPDGKRIAYVSFQKGSSAVYIVELATGVGATEPVSNAKGINGAPAFSPDGTKLALTLSKSGNPEIYVMDIASRSVRQVTTHYGIDTEAVWMPDGQTLLFTSDRGGKPQIYQISAAGGEAKRVTFTGEYNARATVSYDGRKIATAQGTGSIYRIALLDRSFGGNGRSQLLSPGNLDESPSFAPNASMILYATKEGRRGVLYAVSADGRVRQRLVLSEGDVREPAWSPYR
jgi:TolB protein